MSKDIEARDEEISGTVITAGVIVFILLVLLATYFGAKLLLHVYNTPDPLPQAPDGPIDTGRIPNWSYEGMDENAKG